MSIGRRPAGAVTLGVAAICAALALTDGGTSADARADGGRPNVVVVMTDDQARADMSVMPNTRALVGDAGTSFANSIVSFPLCCPSRATFLTGQYATNHGVRTGNGYQQLDNSNTLPVWLQSAGYVTAHVGKYVNGYGFRDPTEVPAGWSEWYAFTDRTDTNAFNYRLNENGRVVGYGSTAADFKGDVLTRRAVSFINRAAPSPAPFFLNVAYNAPHATPSRAGGYQRCFLGAQPAPRHRGAFASTPLPRSPNFNEANVSDKHKEIRRLPALSESTIQHLTVLHQCRLESLLQIDEGVGQLIDALRASGELDNTLFIYTSDNGYFEGQHRIPRAKLRAYEEALRVPLLIRGPGFPSGEVDKTLVANIDLASTILAAAGASPGVKQDGVRLTKLIRGGKRNRPIMIENAASGATAYTGVRTRRYSYAEYANGGSELYDLRKDKYELKSVDSKMRYRKAVRWLHKRTKKLARCHGGKCRRSVPAPGPRPHQ